MASLRYLHLDVFAATLGGGNHLGVVIGADGWSDQAMQRFARWTALVETTFLLPPTDPTLPAILEFQWPSTAIVNAAVPRSARGIVWVITSMVVAVVAVAV